MKILALFPQFLLFPKAQNFMVTLKFIFLCTINIFLSNLALRKLFFSCVYTVILVSWPFLHSFFSVQSAFNCYNNLQFLLSYTLIQ